MNSLPPFLTEAVTRAPYRHVPGEIRTPVLEKGVRHLARIIQESYAQWESSRRDGLLQQVDPRIKLFFLVLFLVLVSVKRHFAPQLGVMVFLFLLATASRLDLFPLYRRILGAALLFGVLVPLPSLLNLFDGTAPIYPLWHLGQPYQFWLYRLPETIGISGAGLQGMGLLALRIANSVTLSLLVLHTTSFPDLIKALRIFRVPESFIAVITLSYKYVFAFTRTLEEMHLAKKSRLLGTLDASQSRHWAAGRISFIFNRTQSRCEEIFKAMISRGYENRITLHAFRRLTARDWSTVAASLAVYVAFLLW